MVGEVWFRVAGYVLVCEKAGSWPGCSIKVKVCEGNHDVDGMGLAVEGDWEVKKQIWVVIKCR